MSKHLIIVESPAKAKKIQPYLGKDFEAVASLGHVRDLPKKGMAIDIEHNFEPTYEISPEKKSVIADLKKRAKAAEDVWLASDPDREGEAIAWHLCQALGIKPETAKRIVFYEITEPAVKAAVQKPRTVDKNLVDAQQARRVLDRLVGYELSPVLWRKVKPGLSAGRVQSVAVRLIVEREREIDDFKAESHFKVVAEFDVDGSTLKADLARKIPTEDEAKQVLQSLLEATFAVENLEAKPSTRNPAPPFTTSTLQQEASRKLGFSVRQTMTVAQRLYEQGAITYMRTDSVNLSEIAVKAAAGAITKMYGDKYVQTRAYKTKTAGAQEAHEAIRPTDFNRTEFTGDRTQARLYDLIWKRAIASQMSSAQLEKTVVTISAAPTNEKFEAKAETVQFDGFLKVYIEGRDEEENEDEAILPPLKIGQNLQRKDLSAVQTFSRPKPRYTEASLVRRLEEMGIGRPSTYAPTISTIQDRGYVEKTDVPGVERTTIKLFVNDKVEREEITERTPEDRGKLVPTPIGTLVTDFLVKHFPEVVDYNFTAKAEDEFDEIAEGKKQWNKMIADFYKPFHQTVEDAADISRTEASGARELGKDPKTGKPVIVRMGRFGPMVQIGQAEDEEKPQFAAVPPGQKMEDLTLDEALELFALPRKVAVTPEGEEVMANFGRFGPYIKFGNLFVSIKPDDPFNISSERALELVTEKKQAEAQKNIKEFPGTTIKVLNGRYGPYVTDGKTNARIPKGQEPAAITQEQATEMLKESASKPKRRGRR